MVKKCLSIALALAMLFSLSACNTLNRWMNDLSGEESEADIPLDEDKTIYFFGDGEDGDFGGSFRVEFETDEDGNLIGKIEQDEEDKQEDEKVEQKVESSKSEPNQGSATVQGRSIISHLGLSKNDIEQLYGTGLTLDQYGALYYKDGRTPLRFYFMGNGNPENLSGDATVSAVSVKGGTYPICSYLTGNETGDEVVAKGGYYCGSDGSLWMNNGSEWTVIFDGKDPNGACLVCLHADDEGMLCNFNYYWKNESDCNKKPADLIIVG